MTTISLDELALAAGFVYVRGPMPEDLVEAYAPGAAAREKLACFVYQDVRAAGRVWDQLVRLDRAAGRRRHRRMAAITRMTARTPEWEAGWLLFGEAYRLQEKIIAARHAVAAHVSKYEAEELDFPLRCPAGIALRAGR